jgi:hypothetical protein
MPGSKLRHTFGFSDEGLLSIASRPTTPQQPQLGGARRELEEAEGGVRGGTARRRSFMGRGTLAGGDGTCEDCDGFEEAAQGGQGRCGGGRPESTETLPPLLSRWCRA